ncbi:MAG: DedA family protein, partial [bacterium]
MWPDLTLPEIQSLIALYGYLLLFPITVVEGPIVGVIAGLLVATGQLNWFWVFLVLFAGDLAGDVAYYALGRYGHGPLMRRLASKLGLTEARMRPIEDEFRRHDAKLILIGKTQALGSVILYLAGAVRMPLGRFLWWNTVGTIPKVVLFEAAGYFFGASLTQASRYLDYAGVATFALALILLGSYLYFRKYLGAQMTPGGKE